MCFQVKWPSLSQAKLMLTCLFKRDALNYPPFLDGTARIPKSTKKTKESEKVRKNKVGGHKLLKTHYAEYWHVEDLDEG